jgi:hypothetical protein
VSMIQYNGIALEIVKTLSYRREPVYSGFCYLYTRHTVKVQAVFAPGATSYDFSNGQRTLQAGVNPPGIPVVGGLPVIPGIGMPTKNQGAVPDNGQFFGNVNVGNLTDRAIRHLLMQKRARLLYTAGGPETEELTPAQRGNAYQAQKTFRAGNLQQATIILDMPTCAQPTNNPTPQEVDGGLFEFDAGAQEEPVVPSAQLPSPFALPNPQPIGEWGGQTVDYVVDCTDGPTPLDCNVWRIDGTGTFRVDFTIQTDVNEARFFFNRPPIMLSHTWSMDIEVDVDGFSTRTIDGKAIFRRDVLEQQQVRPDDFRGLLVHPIDYNTQRLTLRVSQLEDGNTLRYQIVDKEFSHRVQFPNVQRVEAFARIGMNRPSNYEQIVGKALFAVEALSAINPFGGHGSIVSAAQHLVNVLPTSYVDAVVRLWGNNTTSLVYLRNCGLRILNSRFSAIGTMNNTLTVDEGYDWVGRYVELHWRITLSTLAAAVLLLNQAIDGFNGVRDNINLIPGMNVPQVPKIKLADGAPTPAPKDWNKIIFNRIRYTSTVEENILLGRLVRVPLLDGNPMVHRPHKGFATYMDDEGNPYEADDQGTYFGACVAQMFHDTSVNPWPTPGPSPTGNFNALAY